jgi:hypothetical protein
MANRNQQNQNQNQNQDQEEAGKEGQGQRQVQKSGAEGPAGERHRDEQRSDRGPAYHGGDWSKADQEDGRSAMDLPAEDEVRSDFDRADEEISDPGTRGAVFGKGGRGLVERDDKSDLPTVKKS